MTDSSCASRQKALVAALHRDFFKPRGFGKQDATLRRVVAGEPFGVVLLLNVQSSGGNRGDDCGVYVNLGAYVTGLVDGERPEEIKEHECPFRQRIGSRWRLRADDDLRPLVAAICAEAGPWLDAHEDPVARLRRLEPELQPADIGAWLGLVEVCCRMWARLGERDRAAAALRAQLEFFARERPRADPARVHQFARVIGVGPL